GLLGSSPIRFRSLLKTASLESKSCLATEVDPAHTAARQRALGEAAWARMNTIGRVRSSAREYAHKAANYKRLEKLLEQPDRGSQRKVSGSLARRKVGCLWLSSVDGTDVSG